MFLSNTPTIKEVNATKIDSFFVKIVRGDYAPLERRATNNQTKLSQLYKSRLNLRILVISK